jgi:uncharacterized protein (TIRG00374 family)
LGGEPLQAYLLHKRHGVAATSAAASVVLDKSLELQVNSAFLGLGVWVVTRLGWMPPVTSAAIAFLAAVLFLGPIVYSVAVASGRQPASSLLRRLRWGRNPAWAGRIEQVGEAERHVGEFLRTQRLGLAAALLLSILAWLALAGEYWLMTQFLRLDLDLASTIGSLTAARLAILVPVPAALGVLEASQVAALSLVGRLPAEGAALGLLIRARDVSFGATGIALGAALLRRQSPSRRGVPRALDRP